MLFEKMPSFPGWNSGFRELEDARREMQRLFGSFTGAAGASPAGVYPAINVTEDPDAIHVRAEVPGIRAADLDVTVENGTLTISGERRPAEEENASFHRREREWGAFRRSLTLGTRVDTERVEAAYTDGILTITLPKAAESRPKQITVRAES